MGTARRRQIWGSRAGRWAQSPGAGTGALRGDRNRGCPGQGLPGNVSWDTHSFRRTAPVGGSNQHLFSPTPATYTSYIYTYILCVIYTPLCRAWAVEMHALTTGCHSSPPQPRLLGRLGGQAGGPWGGCCEPQEGPGTAVICSKCCQLVLARRGSRAGAPILQGIKRDAPVTRSVGTGGHTAPEGVVVEGMGGSNPPTESGGHGLSDAPAKPPLSLLREQRRARL